MQSDNQINSRIEQDRFVRVCPFPSVQSYLFTRPERLIQANQEMYRQKLLQNEFDFAVIIRLIDSKESQMSNSGTMLQDYFTYIDPFVFNPVYQRSSTDYFIETNLYRISDGALVWKSISKKYPAGNIPEAMQQNLQAVFSELKRKK